MTVKPVLQGQPLAMLCLLTGSWIAFRALTWQAPAWSHELHPPQPTAATAPELAAALPHADPARSPADPVGLSVPGYWPSLGGPLQWSPGLASSPPALWYQPSAVGAGPIYLVQQAPARRTAAADDASLIAASHQLMWMAALARLAAPGGAGAGSAPELAGSALPAAVPLSPGLARTGADRWSADAWMLMRREAAMSPAASRPLYGGSQIGAVLRYQLDPRSSHRPTAYLRGSSSLGAIRESEVALGLGLRPLAGFPLVVAGEARAFRSMGSTSFRPAAIAYTELQPKELPMDLLAEAYLQGGYVGGKFATPFVDGQLRIDHPLGKFGAADVRVGAGVWGGAQKGASRLDVGPGATARMKLMGRPSRVSMDYRFRVAGDAEPGSGPAVTVSTGF